MAIRKMKTPAGVKRGKKAIIIGDLDQQFQKLHNEHLIIIEKLNELKEDIRLIPRMVSPALETQIKRARGLSLKIDQQVPDKT